MEFPRHHRAQTGGGSVTEERRTFPRAHRTFPGHHHHPRPRRNRSLSQSLAPASLRVAPLRSCRTQRLRITPPSGRAPREGDLTEGPAESRRHLLDGKPIPPPQWVVAHARVLRNHDRGPPGHPLHRDQLARRDRAQAGGGSATQQRGTVPPYVRGCAARDVRRRGGQAAAPREPAVLRHRRVFGIGIVGTDVRALHASGRLSREYGVDGTVFPGRASVLLVGKTVPVQGERGEVGHRHDHDHPGPGDPGPRPAGHGRGYHCTQTDGGGAASYDGPSSGAHPGLPLGHGHHRCRRDRVELESERRTDVRLVGTRSYRTGITMDPARGRSRMRSLLERNEPRRRGQWPRDQTHP